MSILRVARAREITTLWAGFFGKIQAMLVHRHQSLRSFCYGFFNSMIAYSSL